MCTVAARDRNEAGILSRLPASVDLSVSVASAPRQPLERLRQTLSTPRDRAAREAGRHVYVSPAAERDQSETKLDLAGVRGADLRLQVEYEPGATPTAPASGIDPMASPDDAVGLRVDAHALSGRLRAHATYDGRRSGARTSEPELTLDYELYSTRERVLSRTLEVNTRVRQHMELPADDDRGTMVGYQAENELVIAGTFAGLGLSTRHIWSADSRVREGSAGGQKRQGIETELSWPFHAVRLPLPYGAATSILPTLRYRNAHFTIDRNPYGAETTNRFTETTIEDGFELDVDGRTWALTYAASRRLADPASDARESSVSFGHDVGVKLRPIPALRLSAELDWRDTDADSERRAQRRKTVGIAWRFRPDANLAIVLEERTNRKDSQRRDDDRRRVGTQVELPLGSQVLARHGLEGRFLISQDVEFRHHTAAGTAPSRQTAWSVTCRVELPLP